MSRQIIGCIGMGNIGLPVAMNLIQSGYQVVAYALSPKPEFESAGGHMAASVREVSEQADVIVESLPSIEALEMTTDSLLKAARTGQVIIEISSYPFEVKSAQAKKLAKYGITMLDCEISGLPFMVSDRSATVFQSGDQEAIRSVQAVFAAMTDNHINLGEFGKATKMKLLANMMVAIHNSVAAEALNLAARAGVDLDEMLRALATSAAGSITFSNKAPIMIARDFEHGKGPFRNMFAYLERVAAMAEEVGAQTPLLDTVCRYYKAAEAEGRADQDIAAIIEMLEAESTQGKSN